MVAYLVSGDRDIEPSGRNLRRAGRRVRDPNVVRDDAAVEMRARRRAIVIAHGSVDGTVSWFKTAWATRRPWLWVGMPRPPGNVRIYLYCCHAGALLRHHLRACEVFGHHDVVPMPVDQARRHVLLFLGEVERLVGGQVFDAGEWRRELLAYVDDLLQHEVDHRTGMLVAPILVMLRISLA